MSSNFDILIMGGGPGGYVAAIRAAQLGQRVALIEKEHLGGVCLNWGCIPTKALLKSAEVHHLLTRLPEFGFSCRDIKFDIHKIVERSRRISAQLNKGVQALLKKNKVTVIMGKATLKGNNQVEVHSKESTQVYQAPSIIIATGARARILPGLEPDGKNIWTAREAMLPQEMPRSLLIIGSGAIGVEFASFYRTLGAEVTMIEMQNRILPSEDPEISQLARQTFEEQGIKFHTETTVAHLEKKGDSLTAVLQHPHPHTKSENIFDKVIVAVGVTGNTEDLGLEQTQVKVEKGHIVTYAFGRTDAPGIYAIGDVAGPPWLAHKASHEGVLCVEKIVHPDASIHPLKKECIPGCIYSFPQIASLGLTEDKAKEEGRSIKVGRFPYIGNGKALAIGEAKGLIKTIFDATSGELLGAHMIGAEVTELIQGYVIAKNLEATEEELIDTIFPHPTLSEMMHEAVLDAHARALHY